VCRQLPRGSFFGSRQLPANLKCYSDHCWSRKSASAKRGLHFVMRRLVLHPINPCRW